MAVCESRPPLIPKKSSSSSSSMLGASVGTPKRQLPRPKTYTPSGRRRSSSSHLAYDDDFFRSLAELDETVASIGGDSASIREEISVSTDFGHNVLTSRHAMIGNMEKVKNDHRSIAIHRRSRSVSSRRSKRGASLERLIHRTITTSYDLDSDHVHVNLARSPSTEDILRDLNQADAILASELSMSSNLLPPILFDDEPDLLPPTHVEQADTSWEWNPFWQDPSSSGDDLKMNKSQSTNDTEPTFFDDPFDAWPAFETSENRPFDASPFGAPPRSDRPDPVGDRLNDSSVERFDSSFGSLNSQAFSIANFDPTLITDFSKSDNPFSTKSKRSSPSCVAEVEGTWL